MKHFHFPTVLCAFCLCIAFLFSSCSSIVDEQATASLDEQEIPSALREDDNLDDEDLPLLANTSSSKERTSSIQNFSLEAARDRATTLFPGTVIAFGPDIERGLVVWEVYVRNSAGAVVEFSFTQSAGELVEAEGYNGPFNYTLQPVTGVIDLSRALAAATALQQGTIVRWEFERNRLGAWEYEVFVSTANGIAKVKVDPVTAVARLDNFRSASAGGPSFGPSVITPAPTTVLNTVTSILSGTVFRSELHGRHEPHWRVFLAASSGGIVVFQVASTSGAVIKIEGDLPPFTYDLTPAPGLLPFSRARDLANAALARSVSNATLYEWQIKLEQKGWQRGQWVYEFEFLAAGTGWDVKLDAANGGIIEIKSKRPR
jgi:uncharacterized membrane protein YkoI